jgi:hypothetical protein
VPEMHYCQLCYLLPAAFVDLVLASESRQAGKNSCGHIKHAVVTAVLDAPKSNVSSQVRTLREGIVESS